tara:strand:+ start:2232 stop:3251 length:1020 start_codon:yes stop_codon:yes gene_type:complete
MNDLGRDILVSDRCTLWLIDDVHNETYTHVGHGIDALRMTQDKGIVGECIQGKRPIIINNVYDDERFNKEMDLKTGYKTESILAVPIYRNDGHVMGVYQAINKLAGDKMFTNQDIERLIMTATFSSKSIESAVLYEEVEETQKELVYILGEAGESRSKETGNHVRRVGEFSYVLAKAYGLNEEECQLIRLGAPLHDLGKVAIPDAILNKPGKLTEEEFEIMKDHAVIGYNILNKSQRRILQAAAIMAYEHQEKYNGRGYPRGLKGEEIHIYGRICAIADVFDALSHDRCYKKAWPFDKVVSLFIEERGEHFDPHIVDLMLENIDEFKRIKDEYADKFDH